MFVRLPITYYIIFPFLVTCTYYHSYRFNVCMSVRPVPVLVPVQSHGNTYSILLLYRITFKEKQNKIKSLLLFYFNILLFLFLKDILDYRLFVQPISSFTFSLSSCFSFFLLVFCITIFIHSLILIIVIVLYCYFIIIYYVI